MAINCYSNQGITPHALGLGHRDCSVPSHPHTPLKRVTGSSRGRIVWAQLILYDRPSSLRMGDSTHTPPSSTGNLATAGLPWLWREAARSGRRRKGETLDVQGKQNQGTMYFGIQVRIHLKNWCTIAAKEKLCIFFTHFTCLS